MQYSYYEINIPESKKATGEICRIADLTGINADLDSDIHEGFTIGNGKTLYWMMIWHKSGHVTVYSKENASPRWIVGDTTITVHFK